MTQAEAASRKLRESEQLWDRAWDRVGSGGKVFLVLLMLGVALPFMLQLTIFFYLWLEILPQAPTLIVRLAILTAMFGFLTVMATTVQRWSNFILSVIVLRAGTKKPRRVRPT